MPLGWHRTCPPPHAQREVMYLTAGRRYRTTSTGALAPGLEDEVLPGADQPLLHNGTAKNRPKQRLATFKRKGPT